jgi:tetratricopeptide (TPR) repeat protein
MHAPVDHTPSGLRLGCRTRCRARYAPHRARMSVRRLFICAAVLALAGHSGDSFAACKLGRIAELPVTMIGMRPLVPAQINGADAQFVVDSGAFYSTITPASAAEYKLHVSPAPYGLRIIGIGGSADASVATVDVFTLAGARLRDLQFVVAGGENGGGAVGALGQNILRLTDAEYDLANGAVRLWRPEDCRNAMLAYWATSQPYSVIDIDRTTLGEPHIVGDASLNGHRIRVMFDSGATSSMLTLRAAERAGFDPKGADVQSRGLVRGVGAEAVNGWIGTFASFEIGDDQIRNARLHIADTQFILGVDMLLGDDFFLSHRIYIATSQDKLYFTSNGGPVFNLTAPSPQQASAAAPPPASGPQAQQNPAEPADAAGFARRGTAFAARQDFPHAIADLTRATELDPTNPQYFYELGEAQLAVRQARLALTDLDQALQLAPGDVPALVARAEIRIARRDDSAAGADLDAADHFAPKESDMRLLIGDLDIRAGRFAPAIAQLDLWIENHPDDSRKADALNGRCWARALWVQDLHKALSDCNTAVRMRPGMADFLDSRALVELRLGDLAKSIEDDDAALSLQPKNAWLLYCRGVAELRAGRKAAGRADIAAAADLRPDIAQLGRARGVTP